MLRAAADANGVISGVALNRLLACQELDVRT